MARWLDSEFVWVQNLTSRPSPPNLKPPPQPNSMRLRWSRATPPRSTTRPTRCSPPTCTVVPRPLLSTSAPSVVLPTVYARLTRYETGSFVFVSTWFATGLLKRESRLEQRVADDVIAGVGIGGHGIPQESEELVAELDPDLVVHPAHQADAHSFDGQPRVERPARAANPELIFRNELGGLAKVHT